MEETYTQAIDIRQYKRSGTHLNLLVVSKKEGLSEIPLGEFHKDRIFVGRDASKCGIALDSKIVSSVHAKNQNRKWRDLFCRFRKYKWYLYYA